MEKLARVGLWIVQRLPLSVIRKLGRVVGIFLYYAMSDRRRTAHSNLDLAYGGSLTPSQKIEIAKGSFINLATMGFEFCASPGFKEPMSKILRVLNDDQLVAWVEEGRPMILLVPHMGNWEVCSRWFAEHGVTCNAVTRKQKQPWVSKIVSEIRAINGYREIDKRNALRPVLTAIRENKIVVMLIDQYARRDAVEVQFFGHPAMTVASAALIAMKTGCDVRIVAAFRFPDGSFGAEVSEKIEVVDTGDRVADLVTNTQKQVSAIESYVRRYPKDWMWMHRRWKLPDRKPARDSFGSNKNSS